MIDKEPFFTALKKKISFSSLKPGNFFFGEQALIVRNYLRQLPEVEKEAGQQVQLRTYFLFDTEWPEILDEASTPDIFSLAERKIFLIFFPEYEEDDQQVADKFFRQYVSPYQQEIERFFSSPPPAVFLVIVFPGKLKRGQKMLEFFSALAKKFPANFGVDELKTPREPELIAWITEELKKRGKKISPTAARKLLEVTGSELLFLSNELEKLSLYAGEQKEIEEDDVLAVCAWQKTYDRFAIEEVLESGTLEEALAITSRFFADAPDVSEVINFFTSISRYIVSLDQAKVEVERLKVPVKEVFKKLRPQLVEGWSLFDRKLAAFTECLKNFSQKELDNLVHELAKIDLKLKSSDLDPQILIETFLVKFFQLKNRRKGKEA